MPPMKGGHLQRFRQDAARWVRPEDVADLKEVSPLVVLKLLYRHLSLRAMAWFRLASWLKDLGVPGVAGFAQRRILREYGLELVPGAVIGGGLYIAHPVGCTIYAESVGENVSIVANVTVGHRHGWWPSIGDEVYVGAGARILGGINLGDGARVGANAVVLHDVAPGCTVVGVPARPYLA